MDYVEEAEAVSMERLLDPIGRKTSRGGLLSP